MEVSNLLDISLDCINLVLLDLDNTLYEYDRCHAHALHLLAGEMSKYYNVSESYIQQLYSNYRARTNAQNLGTASSHSRLFYIQGMVEQLSNFTDTALITKLDEIYWASFIEHMELYDDAIAFLKLCETNKINVVLVTDMLCQIQFKKIKKLGIGPFFKFIVTSEEAGVEKPHPFIFELAITKILATQAKVDKIVVIGDNRKKDVFCSRNYAVSQFHVLRNG